VKTLDRRAIQAAQATRLLDGITTLSIDEIAVGRGQPTGTSRMPWMAPWAPSSCLWARAGRSRT
jgi:hypothetical protein